jgi:Ni,Fe-hydrogenase I small subunit
MVTAKTLGVSEIPLQRTTCTGCYVSTLNSVSPTLKEATAK